VCLLRGTDWVFIHNSGKWVKSTFLRADALRTPHAIYTLQCSTQATDVSSSVNSFIIFLWINDHLCTNPVYDKSVGRNHKFSMQLHVCNCCLTKTVYTKHAGTSAIYIRTKSHASDSSALLILSSKPTKSGISHCSQVVILNLVYIGSLFYLTTIGYHFLSARLFINERSPRFQTRTRATE
jgi:hypothetical protein